MKLQLSQKQIAEFARKNSSIEIEEEAPKAKGENRWGYYGRSHKSFTRENDLDNGKKRDEYFGL
jgi:hypothetical protein